MPKVIITTDKQGKTKVEVDGATGDSCQKLTRGMIDRIGKTEHVDLKPEFSQQSDLATESATHNS
jgi:hypothetical protein